LYDDVDVGFEILCTLFEAIAIVLAFVMRKPRSYFADTIRRVRVPDSRLVRARSAVAAEDQDAGFSHRKSTKD
jgi:hypothetical protein